MKEFSGLTAPMPAVTIGQDCELEIQKRNNALHISKNGEVYIWVREKKLFGKTMGMWIHIDVLAAFGISIQKELKEYVTETEKEASHAGS